MFHAFSLYSYCRFSWIVWLLNSLATISTNNIFFVFLVVLKIHSILVYNFKYRTRFLTFKWLISFSTCTSHAENVSHCLASFFSLFRLMLTVEMVMYISPFVPLLIMTFESLLWFSYTVIPPSTDVNFFNDPCIEKIPLISLFTIFDGWEPSYIFQF